VIFFWEIFLGLRVLIEDEEDGIDSGLSILRELIGEHIDDFGGEGMRVHGVSPE
jgi:hypothetical protein